MSIKIDTLQTSSTLEDSHHFLRKKHLQKPRSKISRKCSENSVKNQGNLTAETAGLVLKLLRDKEKCSEKEIIDFILAQNLSLINEENKENEEKDSCENKIQKTIYDVISVLSAINLIDKNTSNNEITLNKSQFLTLIPEDNKEKSKETLQNKGEINVRTQNTAEISYKKLQKYLLKLLKNYMRLLFYIEFSNKNTQIQRQNSQEKIEFPFNIINEDPKYVEMKTYSQDQNQYQRIIFFSNKKMQCLKSEEIIIKTMIPYIYNRLLNFNEESNEKYLEIFSFLIKFDCIKKYIMTQYDKIVESNKRKNEKKLEILKEITKEADESTGEFSFDCFFEGENHLNLCEIMKEKENNFMAEENFGGCEMDIFNIYKLEFN